MRPSRLVAAAGALGLAAVGSPAALAWGPPQRASSGAEDARTPGVAVSPAGDAIAAWVQERDGRGTVVAEAAPAGRRWSAPRRISSPGLAAIDPAVAALPGGGGIVVWRQADRTRVLRGTRQAVYVVRARELTAAGRWGPVQALSDPRQKVGEPQVAIDGRGAAVAAWHWGTGTRAGTPGHVGEIQLSEKPPGGHLDPRAPGLRGHGLRPGHPPAAGRRRGRGPRARLVAVRPPPGTAAARGRSAAAPRPRPGAATAACPSTPRGTRSRASPSSPAARSWR